MSRILVLIFLFLHQNYVKSNGLSPFSQTNIAVWFDPSVAVNDAVHGTAYNVQELIPMISKISSRFSKIMCTAMEENTGFTYRLIPTAVATYNREHKGPNQPPIELLLPFRMSVSKNETRTNFDIAKRLADEANQIYPETIKWLYMHIVRYEHLSDDTVEYVKSNLIYVQTKLSGTEYMLGIYSSYKNCGSDTYKLPKYLSGILPYLKGILFRSYPTETYLLGEPHKASTFITKIFEKCLHKILNYNKNISLQLYTTWLYSNKTNTFTHDQKLVQYWLSINDWAMQSNVSVVFSHAFNTPFERLEWAYSGWWKLIENSSYRDTSQYVYEEKRYSSRQAPKTGSDNTNATQVLPVVVGISVLVFVIITAASWKPLRRKLEQHFLKQNNVYEFYDGNTQTTEEDQAGTISEIQQAPYKRDLELSKSQFTVEMNSLLGSGAFGAVYQGSVKLTNMGEQINVAVKTTKRSSPSSAIKGLMSEIKVLSYLGKHENIVNIEGAYTRNIRKGKLYIFLELCELGSLDKYLRANTFVDNDVEVINPKELDDIELNVLCYTDLSPGELKTSEPIKNESDKTVVVEGSTNHESKKQKQCLNLADLRRWAYEIANGMEFLASKKVVHADMATRNVLLTVDRRAKISDFGLSRRLYEYGVYFKTQQEPLPWRYMAPESLRRMEFNEKTDVWAFGITLWEIYSSGDLPYEGIVWSPNFSSQLTQGLRLQEPTLNEHGVYSIMLKCWNMDPAKRPTFSELKLCLQ